MPDRSQPSAALRPSVRGEEGFTLVESMMAAVLLVMVGTSLSGVLASSVATYSASRERTLAEQLIQDQIEAIRRMPFSSVGVPNGNPSGHAAADARDRRHRPARDDEPADLVRRRPDAEQLPHVRELQEDRRHPHARRGLEAADKEVTYVSAAAKNAATESVITALVMDYGTGGALAGATVNLATGPSAPRTDITDASGKAIFPALTANPPSGGQAYYDLNVTPPFGYVMLKDDLPPSGVAHNQLGVSEPWPTTLRAYKPCTVNVNIPTPPTGHAGRRRSRTRSRSARRAAPRRSPSPRARRSSARSRRSPASRSVPMPTLHRRRLGRLRLGRHREVLVRDRRSEVVPADYVHNNLTQNFSLAGAGARQLVHGDAQVSALTIKVQNAGGTLLGGARVAISGGPVAAPGIYIAATTATSGGRPGC